VPTILLVRHAQASYGESDYDVLSPLGREQAVAVRDALLTPDVGLTRVISGSLRRQIDSARPWLADGAEPEVDPRWDEYDAGDVLDAHGRVRASLERRPDEDAPVLSSRDFQAVLDEGLLAWIAAGDDSTADVPWPAFRGRIRAALDDLAASLASGETAAVFTSSGVIATVCAMVLGVPDSAMVTFNHVSVNGSLTKLTVGRRGTSLISFNEHAHLQARGMVTYR
jgi:broad specificity phosphatase PhoE